MEKIEFQQGGLFHDMVTAYISALSGLLLFRKEFKFDLSVKVGLASTVRTLEFPVFGLFKPCLVFRWAELGVGLFFQSAQQI